MKRAILTATALMAVGCIEAQPAASPALGGLVQPNQSPPPTTPDATMPASLAPPPAAANIIQTNSLYRTGSTFFIVGGTFIGAGIAFAVLGVVLPCKLGDSGCSTPAEVQSEKNVGDAFLATGIAGLIAGAIFIGVGIPFAIAGVNQAKRQLGIALISGPGGVGVRF